MCKPTFRVAWLLAALLALCAACGTPQTPTPTSTPSPLPPTATFPALSPSPTATSPPSVVLMVGPNTDVTRVLPGETVALSVAASGADLSFRWAAARGSLSDLDTPAVIYTAPDLPGLDTVTVTVSSESGVAVRTISLRVVPPIQPTPTPTARRPSIAVIDASGLYCTGSGTGGTVTLAIKPPREVSQIRLEMIRPALKDGYSLWELSVYGPDLAGDNLMKGARIQAPPQSHQDHGPDKAIDGDLHTRWVSSPSAESQWLEITLAEPQTLHWLVLNWAEAYASEYCVRLSP